LEVGVKGCGRGGKMGQVTVFWHTPWTLLKKCGQHPLLNQ